MFTESIAHRDQSKSPRAHSSSSTRRWSLAHTRAWLHSVKRRYTVDHDGPNTSGVCPPGAAGGSHEQDGSQYLPVAVAPPPTTLRSHRRHWHHSVEQLGPIKLHEREIAERSFAQVSHH